MKEMGVGIIGTGWVSDEYIRSFEMNRMSGWTTVLSSRTTSSGA